MVPFLDLRRRVARMRSALEVRLVASSSAAGSSSEKRSKSSSTRSRLTMGHDMAWPSPSGTHALWLTLEALGVGPGNEVITVSHTCVPTVAAILKSGATPVLVDVDLHTMTMDPELVQASCTSRTKCILPVHLYGQCADLIPLRQLAAAHGIALVEDCAQAHGAEYRGKRAECFGHAGCYSFYATKNLGALGDGGMVITDDASLAQRLCLLRSSDRGGEAERCRRGAMRPAEYDVMARLEDDHWWYAGLRRLVVESLRRLRRQADAMTVIDAGCGTGGCYQALRRQWPEACYTGIDLEPRALRYCRQRRRRTVVRAAVQHFPMRPGGLLLLNLPAFEPLRGEHDAAVGIARRFRLHEVRWLLEDSGFTVIMSTYWNMLLFLPMLAWRWLSRLNRAPVPTSDVGRSPMWLNVVLRSLVLMEVIMAQWLPLACGASVFVVDQKPM